MQDEGCKEHEQDHPDESCIQRSRSLQEEHCIKEHEAAVIKQDTKASELANHYLQHHPDPDDPDTGSSGSNKEHGRCVQPVLKQPGRNNTK